MTMRFRLSNLLSAVGVVAVFMWMHVHTYKSPEPYFTSMGVSPVTSVPGYGWPCQCVDELTVITQPMQRSVDQDGTETFTVHLEFDYRVRPWQLGFNFAILCVSILIITRSLNWVNHRATQQRTMRCTRSTA